MSDFVLDAHASRTCPVKTQHLFNPLVAQPPSEPDEALTEIFEGGVEFERHVIEQLVARADADVMDLRDREDAVEACAAAMRDGVRIIVGGPLPPDVVGHRRGSADVWLRGPDTEDGRPGYFPVEAKHHRVLEFRKSGRERPFEQPASSLDEPFFDCAEPVPDTVFRVSSRERDLLQVAHYWRMLESVGHAAGGPPMAGIVGTDQVPGLRIVWVPLSEKTIRTFSRTSSVGWRLRSPLERYDHEHGFRLRVARHAMAQTGGPDAPPLLVQPIVIRECTRCLWWQVCRPQLDDDDLSLRIEKAPLDVREISVLRGMGIATTSELAQVDVDALLPEYLPEVAHRDAAEKRLRIAHRRARLMADGIELERCSSGAIEVPVHDVEVDFDIETSADERVYLWGFRVNRGQMSEFVAFSAFEDLDDDAEIELAERAARFLQSLAAEGGSVAVYHYSSYETVRLHQLWKRSHSELLRWTLDWAREHFVDLFSIVQQHWFGVHGLGLKAVATQGPGFEWRDDDPSGLASQAWFDEAVHAEDPAEREAARLRVLEYNEDDVAATAALREWLRAQ